MVSVASGTSARSRVLEQAVRDVHPEPGDPPVQPEPQDLLEHRRDARVAPVPVRLAGVEQVQVPLAVGNPGPGPAAEPGRPVVRRLLAVGAPAVAEDEQVPLGAARRRRKCLLEQRVLGRAVVRHQVDDHPDVMAPARRAPGRRSRRGCRACGSTSSVVADVVAAVVQRRGVERGQPDGVHAQAGQVLKAARKARQVADPVAVGVGEAARVDLVHHRGRPPWIVANAHPLPLSL